MGPLFFLSHATNPAPGVQEKQRKFYNELVEILLEERDSLDPRKVGFFDQESIQVGEKWTEVIANAVRTCRVFLYLPSDAYWSRPWCSKEWGIFQDRIDRWMKLQTAPGAPPPLMVPIHWTAAVPKPPEVLDGHIHFTNPNFGDAYKANGLGALQKLKNFADEYETFKRNLAKLILQYHDQYPLPEGATIFDFDEAPDAFRVVDMPGTKQSAAASSKGPRFIVFIYVVGRRGDLEAYRKTLDSYGDDGWQDWKPFSPTFDKRISHSALDVVRKDGLLDYERIDFGPKLVEELRDAEKSNKIIVIVVDSWSLNLQDCSAVMSSFDSYQFRNCCVVVPWNEDEETRNQSVNLTGLLSRHLGRQRERLRRGLKSPEVLETEIAKAIGQARKEALGGVYQDVEGESYSNDYPSKPVVQGSQAR